MGRYIARRLLQFVPVLIGALFLLHYMTSLGIQLTGDPARAVFGDKRPNETQLAFMRERMGLGDQCLRQPGNPCVNLFVDRLGVTHFWDDEAPPGYLQGSFGTDFRGREITDLLAERAPLTARLAMLAILIEATLGIFAGVMAGLRRGRFEDYFVKVSTVLFIATPVFILGLITQWTVGVSIGNWIRDQGWIPGFVGDIFAPVYRADHPWTSLVIPAFVLAALSSAYIARLTRTSLAENIRGDYVRTAVSKGLRRRRVVGVHTLRNSLIPVVTYLGVDLGSLLGGALITEGIFNVPGIGRQVFQSIRLGEAPIVIGIVTILVVVYLVASLIVDVLYAVLDPRIRYE